MPGVAHRPAGPAIGVLVALSRAAPAAAKRLPDLTLSRVGEVPAWHGKSLDQTGQGYGSPTAHSCTYSTCDSFVPHVRPPARTFPKGPKSPSARGTNRTYS